jgi:hypothetical protein
VDAPLLAKLKERAQEQPVSEPWEASPVTGSTLAASPASVVEVANSGLHLKTYRQAPYPKEWASPASEAERVMEVAPAASRRQKEARLVWED